MEVPLERLVEKKQDDLEPPCQDSQQGSRERTMKQPHPDNVISPGPRMLLILLTLAPFQAGASDALLAKVVDRALETEVRMECLADLAMLEGPLPFDQVIKVRNLARGDYVADLARCLGRCGPKAERELRKLLRRQDSAVQAEAVYALAMMADEADFARSRLRMKKEPVETRVAALRALDHRDSPFARVEALRRLSTASGPLLIEALRILDRKGMEEDIPSFIDVVADRTGMARNLAVRILQERTGYRIGPDAKAWRWFLVKHRTEGTPFRAAETGGEENATLVYLGIPILGEKVVFVLDSSSSMTGRMRESRDQTKGGQAVGELAGLLPRLPEKGEFGVVFFESSVRAFPEKNLLAWSLDGVNKASDFLNANSFQGGTNIHGGLERAFSYRDVEEIILLTDGEPTVGRVLSPSRILSRVAKWNRWRNVRVSAISFSAPNRARRFLNQLARENQGDIRIYD